MATLPARTVSSRDRGSITRNDPAGLRREVVVPVPSYRRPSSLIGLSVVLVLLASAVDAVVWTYQAAREVQERQLLEQSMPTLSHTGSAAVRARSFETELARVQDEMRRLDQRTLQRLREISADEPRLHRLVNQAERDRLVERCDTADPLCGLE